MVGDSKPFESKLGSSLGHSFESVLAIAGDGVIVEAATKLGTG